MPLDLVEFVLGFDVEPLTEKKYNDEIDRVIFNPPATIVIWKNGDKTIVKAQDGEHFDKEKGLAMAIVKYICGNTGVYNEVFKQWCN